MDADAMDGVVDALTTFIDENPDLAEDVDFGSLYIFGTTPKLQEDPLINQELLDLFGSALENRE